jgi:hypothetical protein
MLFDRDGNMLKSLVRDDSYSKLSARGVAVDDAGRMYVVDASHADIQIFDKEAPARLFR